MSTIKTNTLQNTAGTKSVPVDTVVDGSAKAWVNFNGTGTVAIRAGFNVSSITDNGVGNYTVNFTTPLPDTNYATNVSTGNTVGYSFSVARNSESVLTSSSTIQIVGQAGGTGANADPSTVCVSILR
jgi:hypothetical protein